MPRQSQPELEATRQRLIEAAGEVFAEIGYEAATVRRICDKAQANVAAVNYHFRDKMGLYTAVLEQSLCLANYHDLREAAEGDPEQAIARIVHVLTRRILATERGSWHVRIMAHEIARPTEALDRVVAQVTGPNYAVLRGVLARRLGLHPDDDAVRYCAHSIFAQIVHYAHARPVIARLWPEFRVTEERIEQVAQHITRFSIAGLRAIANDQEKQA
jgi:AcrR family transcriptional regulator